jgi:SagB-type dehydrogenase family enzyme
MKKERVAMKLPQPKTEGTLSLERVIQQRRTMRAFDPKALGLDQLSQLLWAAQGITGRRGFERAAPSAGALYPMDLYAAVGLQRVRRLEAGVYHYVAAGHKLVRIVDKDVRNDIARASLSQMWMAQAPLNLVITAAYHRVTGKYGERGVRYALMEAGHVGQNLFLQAEALGLKAGIVGAFHDRRLAEVLLLPVRNEPLLIMPIGYAA